MKNNSTTICYKEQNNGLPSSLPVLIDSEGIYNSILFDDKGITCYMNINDQRTYLKNVRDNKLISACTIEGIINPFSTNL